ncbi:uncharacterized protein LOC126888187 [Diabrotica virgifera virgifera]|uniref:Uncharacterized protein n=1 Tax=Diabrotica virgifera virgifera TaxID=50390 RepID=A0ABM5KPT9_DIAVI|nr:uncharacterized protein LOC126888187 [Diabrotica virgifera virgifera]
MDPLLYWFIFVTLICTLGILGSYLMFSIIRDSCFKRKKQKDTVMVIYEPDFHPACLSKLQYDKHDVEDLTRIERNFKTGFRRLSFQNEVFGKQFEGLLGEKRQSVDKESDVFVSTNTLDKSITSITEEDEESDDSFDRDTVSVDIEVSDEVREVLRIEKEAKKVEKEMNKFVGGTNDLQYYEINEKYIKLMISLCDMECSSIECRKHKNIVLNYIEQCQNQLKLKSLKSK